VKQKVKENARSPADLDGSRAPVLDDPGRETWITAEER
jgi:hypothetical protein